MSIPIVYEDQWLLVVNKPSGLLTIPAPRKQTRCLVAILNGDLKSKGRAYRLHPCHRLDQGTSGLIILAKGKSIQKQIMQEFKQGRIKKTYIAFVQGRPVKNKNRIRNPVFGKSATTAYEVLKRFKDVSLVKVNPLTGRRNQIRIHFKQIGHPVVGEDRFAFRRDFKIRANRLCLHAQELDFQHPVSKGRIHLQAEPPENFSRFLKQG